MPQLFRMIPAVIALSICPLASAFAADAASSQTSSGTIIWDAKPAPATRGPNDTIIWNDDPAPPRAPQASAGSAADKNGIIWDTPRDLQSRATTQRSKPVTRTAPSTSGEAGPCREFQTHIIIDGKSEPAHGTACRQPDGTWRVVNR